MFGAKACRRGVVGLCVVFALVCAHVATAALGPSATTGGVENVTATSATLIRNAITSDNCSKAGTLVKQKGVQGRSPDGGLGVSPSSPCLLF